MGSRRASWKPRRHARFLFLDQQVELRLLADAADELDEVETMPAFVPAEGERPELLSALLE